MAVLTDLVKTYIVQQLATYRTPSEVAELVLQEHGVTVDRRQVFLYDPDGANAPKIADKWKAIHAAAREAFLDEVSRVPSSYRAYRVRELHEQAQKMKRIGNTGMFASLMKQIAEEMGDAYTNRREVTGKGGKDLVPVQPATVIVLPDNGRG